MILSPSFIFSAYHIKTFLNWFVLNINFTSLFANQISSSTIRVHSNRVYVGNRSQLFIFPELRHFLSVYCHLKPGLNQYVPWDMRNLCARRQLIRPKFKPGAVALFGMMRNKQFLILLKYALSSMLVTPTLPVLQFDVNCAVS